MNSDQEIISGLNSSEKSFRLMAIEKILHQGGSAAIFESLSRRQKVETDSECYLLINHALIALEQRLNGTAENFENTGLLDLNSFQVKFWESEPQKQIELLSKLNPGQVKELAPFAVSVLQADVHSLVASRIVQTFALVFNDDFLPELAKKLFSKHLSLRLSILELLIQRAPHELSRMLPKLLVSPDPQIRGLAIRGLAKIDMEEAISHNDFFFSSQKYHEKVVAIENLLFFPFEKIKSGLLKFMSRENDPQIIIRAGVLLGINPDIEVPYRLWEIIEFSSPEKAEVLRTIAADACQALLKSGRLSETQYRQYLENLTQWVKQKSASRVVQECISHLAIADKPLPEVESTIIRNLGEPYVRKAFEEAVFWPIGEEVKEKILGILKANPPDAIRNQDQLPLDQLSADDQIRRVTLWKQAERDGAARELSEIFSSSKSSPELLATSLRTAARMDIRDFISIAGNLLESTDENVASASIEYLTRFEFEKLLPLIGGLVQSKSPRVKSAAIKALKKTDLQQALSVLSSLLYKGSEDQQRSALAGMIHFDFSLVRDFLSDYILSRPTSGLFNDALCLFAANPDPDSLFTLFSLEQDLPESLSKQVRKVREQCQTFLVKSGILSASEVKEREAVFPKLLEIEKEKKTGPVAPYSFRALQNTLERSAGRSFFWFTEKWNQSFGSENFGQVLMIMVCCGMLFGGLWIYGMFVSKPPNLESKGIFIGSPHSIEGSVTGRSIGAGGLTMETADGLRFLVVPGPDGWAGLSRFSPGENIRGRVVPVRVEQNGLIVAKLGELEIIPAKK